MLVTKATICSVMYLQCPQHRLVRISLLITLTGLKVKEAESVSLVHFVNTAEPRFIEPTSIQQSPRYNDQFPLPQ